MTRKTQLEKLSHTAVRLIRDAQAAFRAEELHRSTGQLAHGWSAGSRVTAFYDFVFVGEKAAAG